jgi:SAM-dependent methyltransferase
MNNNPKTLNNILHNSFLCPNCGNLLNFDNKDLKCLNNKCSQFDIQIFKINSKPLLVNFKDSIISESALKNSNGNSVVKRPDKKFHKKIKSYFQKTSKETVLNINNIIEYLKKIDSPNILIVGGGEIGSGLERLYNLYDTNIISFDIYNSENIDFIADAHFIPVKNDFFDLVICQAVLEHVINPQIVVEEIFRVLKLDGMVYAETPFMQQVHEGPFDFTRYSESGHRYLFKKFITINSGFTAGSGTALLWSLSYFFTGLFKSKLAGRLVRILFFWLYYFDKIIPKAYNIDAACGVFFLGVKSNIIISDVEIISHYTGSQK